MTNKVEASTETLKKNAKQRLYNKKNPFFRLLSCTDYGTATVIREYEAVEGLQDVTVLLGEEVEVLDKGVSHCKVKVDSGEEGSVPLENLEFGRKLSQVRVAVLVCFCSIFCYSVYNLLPSAVALPVTPSKDLIENIQTLEKKYPGQLDVYRNLHSCLKDMDEGNSKLCVLLLLYDQECDFNDFLKDIVRTSAQFLISDPIEPIEISGNYLERTLAGESFVEKFKDELKFAKVMLITNIQEIPSNIFSNLHSVCDSSHPLVENSLIALTLKSELNGKRLSEVAEKTMRGIWSNSMQSHKLDPLIVRLTGNVALINTTNFNR